MTQHPASGRRPKKRKVSTLFFKLLKRNANLTEPQQDQRDDDYFERRWEDALRRNLIAITKELDAAKTFLADNTDIPEDEDFFPGFGCVNGMRVYTALRKAFLRRVPDTILARLLLVAHHHAYGDGPAMLFNWDSVENGTEQQELDRCEF